MKEETEGKKQYNVIQEAILQEIQQRLALYQLHSAFLDILCMCSIYKNNLKDAQKKILGTHILERRTKKGDQEGGS